MYTYMTYMITYILYPFISISIILHPFFWDNLIFWGLSFLLLRKKLPPDPRPNACVPDLWHALAQQPLELWRVQNHMEWRCWGQSMGYTLNINESSINIWLWMSQYTFGFSGITHLLFQYPNGLGGSSNSLEKAALLTTNRKNLTVRAIEKKANLEKHGTCCVLSLLYCWEWFATREREWSLLPFQGSKYILLIYQL